jgi:hypothetical protein
MSGLVKIRFPELYKFRPYRTKEDKKRLRDILVHNHFHFSTPNSFNDPFDPRPIMVVGDKDGFNKHYAKLAAESGVKLEIQRTPDEVMALITEKFREDFKSNFRILSLAGNRTSTLLWAHYADNHKGLCIHIDRTVVPFTVAESVRYTQDYPVLHFPLEIDEKEQFVRMFCTKSPEWFYEEEHRMVLFPESYDFQERTMWSEWDGPRLLMRSEAIVGITLGAMMTEELVTEVLRMASFRKPKPKVWKARLEHSSFGLVFEEIAY